MLQVTAVRIVGALQHQNILGLRWVNVETREEGAFSRQAMVDYLSAPDAGGAIVIDELGTVEVRVVGAAAPYVQTFAGDHPTDNLLWLPKY